MDDGGQRLLDVIEDSHVLETFLRENFNSTALDEPGRYDHAGASADGGLVSNAALDSFMFEGQLVDPLRGAAPHASHHAHQVSSHVLQQVLHSPNFSAASALPGSSHQLHSHLPLHPSHHQAAHHLQQSHLVQQHHSQLSQHQLSTSQLQPNHSGLSSALGSSLDVDCLVRARESCARNESEHTLQQLLASGPLGSSQQLLQLHHQSHQLPLHHSHPHLQQLSSSQHVPAHLQQPSSINQHSLSSLSNSSLLHHQHHLHSQHRQHQSHKCHSQPQTQASDISPLLSPHGLSNPLSGNLNSCSAVGSQSHLNVVSKADNKNRSPVKTHSSTKLTSANVASSSVISSGTSKSVSYNSSTAASQLFPSHLLPSSAIQSNSTANSVSHTLPFQNIPTGALPSVSSSHLMQNPLFTNDFVSPNSVYPNLPVISNSLVPLVPNNVSVTNTVTSTKISNSSLSQTKTTSSHFAVPNKSPRSNLSKTSSSSYSATTSRHAATPSPVTSYALKSPNHSLQSSNIKSPIQAQSPKSAGMSYAQIPVVTSPQVSGTRVIKSLLPQTQSSAGSVSNINQISSPQVNSGLKHIPSGQIIQLVTSQNQNRPALAIPYPKPIQPKPQLLPKPISQIVKQPTPPPPGKTLIGPSRPNLSNAQSIVLGAGNQQHTMIAGGSNLGSLMLGSSLLQTGLQQPFLIPQPNGMQLLVRPAGASSAGGQTFFLPMQSQPQVVSSVNKTPQTLVIPASGQTPSIVLPQGLTSALGGTSILNTSQPNRSAAQPILRLVAPQAPLQLQQINTPNGPMLVALPAQPTLSLPGGGVFAAPNTLRALAPQIPGTIQLGSGLGSLINPLQLSTSTYQTNSTNQILTTLSSSLSQISKPAESAVITIPESQVPTNAEQNKSKKKSKKKKKDKDSKEDKGKNKGVSINLNELLKETGIFDENEFGALVEESDSVTTTSVPQIFSASVQTAATTAVSTTTATSSVGQLILSSPFPTQTFPNQDATGGISLGSIPSSMCFTLDPSGKLVLSDASKPPSIALPSQTLNSGGLQLINTSSGTFVIGGDGTLPKSSGSLNSILTLQPPTTSQMNLIESPQKVPQVVKIDNILASSTCSPITSVGTTSGNLKMSLSQAAENKVAFSAPSIASLFPNTFQFSDKNILNSSEVKSITDLNYTLLNRPMNQNTGPTVIVSSNYNNSFLPGTVITTSKGNIISSNSQNNLISSQIKTNIISAQNYDSGNQKAKDESKLKKSSKKKKKDKEQLVVSSAVKDKKKAIITSNVPPMSSQIYVPSSDLNLGGPILSHPPPHIISSGVVNSQNVADTNISQNAIITSVLNTSPVTPKSGPSTSGYVPQAGFIVQPGHQVKQLLITPQNQEALKTFHAQIKDLQAKTGPLNDQDKNLQQKLISEYKKIMATGTPVCHSLTPMQPTLTPSSHGSSIKYSHPVGNKRVLLATNQKKGFSHASSKKSENDAKTKTEITSSQNASVHSDKPKQNKSKHEKSTKSTVVPSDPAQLNLSMPLILPNTKPPARAQVAHLTTSHASPMYKSIGIQSGPRTTILIPASGPPTRSTTRVISQASPIITSKTTVSTGPSSGTRKNKPQESVSLKVTSPVVTISTTTVNKTPTFTIPMTQDQLFEHQLRTDQSGALNPDYKTPFKNKTDACKRLIRYHVYEEARPNSEDLFESDVQFDFHSELLMKKFRSMQYKYQSLLLKDSMRRQPSAEIAMLYRLHNTDEKQLLERQKHEVNKGREMSLPPFPPHWLGKAPEPAYTPLSWEKEWPNQKVYTRSLTPPTKKIRTDLQQENFTSPDDSVSPAEGRLQILEEYEDGRCSRERPSSQSSTLGSRTLESRNSSRASRINSPVLNDSRTNSAMGDSRATSTLGGDSRISSPSRDNSRISSPMLIQSCDSLDQLESAIHDEYLGDSPAFRDNAYSTANNRSSSYQTADSKRSDKNFQRLNNCKVNMGQKINWDDLNANSFRTKIKSSGNLLRKLSVKIKENGCDNDYYTESDDYSNCNAKSSKKSDDYSKYNSKSSKISNDSSKYTQKSSRTDDYFKYTPKISTEIRHQTYGKYSDISDVCDSPNSEKEEHRRHKKNKSKHKKNDKKDPWSKKIKAKYESTIIYNDDTIVLSDEECHSVYECKERTKSISVRPERSKSTGSEYSEHSRSIVPPLKLKSDKFDHSNEELDRSGGLGVAGGLKLTLKKQEGSSGYYRITDESSASDDQSDRIKNVSIVLEDCLQNNKKGAENSEKRNSSDQFFYERKSKKLKSHHETDHSDKYHYRPKVRTDSKKKENIATQETSEILTEFSHKSWTKSNHVRAKNGLYESTKHSKHISSKHSKHRRSY